MKNWSRKIVLATKAADGDLPSTQELLGARQRVLAISPNVSFRETELEHYDASMLDSEQDRRNFLNDLYDWADDKNIWVEWRQAK